MKRILVLLLAIMSLVLFAACTPGVSVAPTKNEPAATPEPASPTPAAEPVVLKFAAQADPTPATQAVIDAFNASQTAYKVEWVQMTNDSGQMHDQLMTSLKDSAEYDIVSLDVVWAGEFAAAGYIEPLDMMMADAGLSKTDYNAGSMASGAYQGKQYVLPFFPDLGLLYIRTDIVSAEDVAKLASGNYTYDDLFAMAEKYAGKGGTETGIVFQAKQYEGLVCNLAEFTGALSDLKGGLETMKKFVDSKKAVPADILNYTEAETHTSFIEGKSVFARNWPYQYGMIKGDTSKITADQVTVAPLPKGDAVGGWLLAINKQSANKEGAFEFLKFLAGQEGQKIMATKGGYVPGWNALLNDADVAAANVMLTMDGFKAAVAKTVPRPVTAEYSKVSDAIQINAHKYLSGNQDIDATIAAIQAALG